MIPASRLLIYRDMKDMGPDMIAPSAKKLWGVEEQKDDSKGILTLNDHQMWRDPTWSTSDHAVSQPITMVPRRSGSFPGSEAANILSPRSSETGGLGVKMVEYVLGSSPTGKDLEPRMRGLVLNPNDSEKKEKDKAPSPFEAGKKDVENGNNPQPNGIVQNGLGDDDKGFKYNKDQYSLASRTPGSRQPSPAEEDINKNSGSGAGGKPPSEGVEGPHHHHHMNHMPHPPHTLHLDSVNQQFEHVMTMDPSTASAMAPFDQGGYVPPQQQQADSPGVLPPSFDVQAAAYYGQVKHSLSTSSE